ncbi:MAG TPA: glycosyltransferase family 1 protein [Myxococcales bacterium]|nr:glycosyltransferase family 1 protein [Myxococcales bacterium]
MRVAVVGRARSLYRFRGCLLHEMVKEGHQVRVFASDLTDAIFESLEGLGVEVDSYPVSQTGLNPIADIRTYYSLKKSLSQYQPDLLFSYNLKPVIYSSLAGKSIQGLESWSLITGLGHVFADSNLKVRALRAVVTPLLRSALSVNKGQFYQNPDDVRDLAGFGISDVNKATLVAGSGVDLDIFDRRPLPVDKVAFLFSGRFLKVKGIHQLVAAFKQVRQQCPNAVLRLAGRVDDNPTSLSKLDVLQLVEQGIIENLGWLEDIRPALEMSSVIVLPSSYREGTPRSILEAMAMGRAVITTDLPGCRETVVDGENGLFVPADDVEALTEAMLTLARDPGLVARMGEASYQLAKRKFDVHKVNDVMLRTMGLRA